MFLNFIFVYLLFHHPREQSKSSRNLEKRCVPYHRLTTKKPLCDIPEKPQSQCVALVTVRYLLSQLSDLMNI